MCHRCKPTSEREANQSIVRDSRLLYVIVPSLVQHVLNRRSATLLTSLIVLIVIAPLVRATHMT
jgi:hypothetical protein